MMIALERVVIGLICLVLCALSIDVWMINTGDFYRAVFPFLDNVKEFTTNHSLIYTMRDEFLPITDYEYKSSFSIILYLYASIVSLFTHTFDLRIWSSLSKIIYVISLYALFSSIIKNKRLIFLFPVFLVPLVTPSIISQFSSFYQEQILITLLPVMAFCLAKNQRTKLDSAMLVVSVLIISTSKSQFFYLPILVSFAEFIFKKNKSIPFHLSMFFIVIIAIACSTGSKKATVNNNYHSLYFGTLLYNKLNNIKNPAWVNEKCVGVDAWGNKFDLTKGAVQSIQPGVCISESKGKGIKESLSIIMDDPSMIIKLPFDKGIGTQLTERYFHVYKETNLIINKNNFLTGVMEVKDELLAKIRMPFAALFMLCAFLIRNKLVASTVFVLSSFTVSQFYISFMGEGYRDLSKHLFGMNYCFDLLLFFIIVSIISTALETGARRAHQAQ